MVVDWWHFHPPMDRKLHQFPPQQPYSIHRKIRPVSSLPPTARNDVGSYPELFFKTRIQTFLPPVECILHIGREESDKRIAQGILFRISLYFLQPHQQTLLLLLLLLLYCVRGFFIRGNFLFLSRIKNRKPPHHVSIFIELLHDTLEAE